MRAGDEGKSIVFYSFHINKYVLSPLALLHSSSTMFYDALVAWFLTTCFAVSPFMWDYYILFRVFMSVFWAPKIFRIFRRRRRKTDSFVGYPAAPQFLSFLLFILVNKNSSTMPTINTFIPSNSQGDDEFSVLLYASLWITHVLGRSRLYIEESNAVVQINKFS